MILTLEMPEAQRIGKILVDGNEVKMVQRLDKEEGWVEYLVKDAEGLYVVKDDEIERRIVYGEVEIVYEQEEQNET